MNPTIDQHKEWVFVHVMSTILVATAITAVLLVLVALAIWLHDRYRRN